MINFVVAASSCAAPEATTAREANDRMNECVADRRRGPAVWWKRRTA
jgi:hypothetical protein